MQKTKLGINPQDTRKCCSFDKTKIAWNYYRGKDCMEIFCKDLRKQAMKIINYKKERNNAN